VRKPLYQHRVGGGVWRVKWHPTDPNLLLVSAMHNGFHVLENDASLSVFY
jgi:diphthamide biosynthesis protein 7